jgi:tetratricopeptide (TPR) repeat protein
MMIRKIATISVLVLSSFAANIVAPSKTELEAMYDKAFREFDAANYAQALKDLDAIDARQPDLAESQNLRGVIFMRQAEYEKAETALQKALAADPKFWNARFNLAEVPFLLKNWPEARKRFQELLSGNASDLQGEATHLIQYKILITYLLEGKENMVDAMLAKFELSPDTPAVHYANAALALHQKNEKEAKDWLVAAEKNFSPQLNKLFAESLYEVGWLEKPAGQTRAALELNSAAERASNAKLFAKAKFEQAEQALQQRDLTAARKLVDEADAADPNQAAISNLRGEILLEQKEFDQAESEFKKAAKADPKSRDALYNLAQVPFKKKEYTKARERFEAVFSATSGADKDQAAQLIKFKIYLTLLLEGKESRAQKMMEQFQFTGDTPALYYAQAAWEFKRNNSAKANDWVTSARKIYSPALNGAFSDAFFDLGWIQAPSLASPAPVVADAAQADSLPAIEPTPIPGMALAQNDKVKAPDATTRPPQATAAVPGMEATTSKSAQTPSASMSPSVETPVASTASPAAARAVIASASEPGTSAGEDENTTSTAAPGASAPAASVPPPVVAAAASPATVLAPAQVREWSKPSLSESLDRNTLLVGALLLAGILLLAWVVVPELRRRMINGSDSRRAALASAPSFDEVESLGSGGQQLVVPTRLAGGPPQISLQLRASEPALRRAAMPLGKPARMSGSGATVASPVAATPAVDFAPSPTEPTVEPETFESEVGEPVASVQEVSPSVEPVLAEAPTEAEFTQPTDFAPEIPFAAAPIDLTPEIPEIGEALAEETSVEDAWAVEETPAQSEVPTEASPVFLSETFVAQTDMIEEQELEEPIGQGQPVPYQIAAEADAPVTEIERPDSEIFHEQLAASAAAAALAGAGALRHSVESPSFAPKVVSTEPMAQQPTTPVTMPQPTQTTPAPVIRTAPSGPMTGVAPQPSAVMQSAAPQPGGGMHTAVQLTFSFEIASLQLTPTFKMGALQLKPTSKIVTMRLAPSQQPQPAMNLQVTFEIATVQLVGGSIGMVRLTPSQQQRPSIISSPSFNIAGLQLVSGADAAPVQLTPSQQGQASVHVTAGFQIATVEFSPSFEIASIVLNSSSKKVSVQLPGAGPSAVEGAPVFDITNVQVGANGEIGMMQLSPQGSSPKPA